MATSKSSSSSSSSSKSTTSTSSTSSISGGFKSNPGSAFGQNGGISIGNGLYSNPSFGGGGNNYTPTYNPTPPKSTVQPTIKQQIFNIKCTGLKPNTIHRFFYEGVDTGSSCIPINPKPVGTSVTLGSPLITDANGNMEFSFYFTSDVEKTVDGINKVKYELAGDKKFEVRASDSTASRIVPYKKY